MAFHCKQIMIGLMLFTLLVSSLPAQDSSSADSGYVTKSNIVYRTGDQLSEYEQERCRLDIYYPQEAKDFATVVWFHGGGLQNGEKFLPEGLKNQGLAIVAPNYRLSPKVKAPAYVEDAAAAVAWTVKNIEQYGGSSKRVFVSGHSAGGYLTSMVGLDPRWLAVHGIHANDLAGLIPYSGQAITHTTIRQERGIERHRPVVDDMAAVHHVSKDAPPLLLISGDREMDIPGRYEENLYLWRLMQVVGHPNTKLYELDGFDHGTMVEPGHPLLLRFVRELSE